MDTDAVIERALNASVEELFASEGEEAFRHIESQVLDKVHSFMSSTCMGAQAHQSTYVFGFGNVTQHAG